MATVYLLCGKVGSGKSTYAQRLKQRQNAVVLNCDLMMLSLFGEYLGDDHARVYGKCTAYLYALAEEVALAGVDVVLDFGFWTRAQRQAVRAAFAGKGISTELHYLKTDPETVTARLARRNETAGGEEAAYRIDEGMRAILDRRFEEPGPDEVDELINSTTSGQG